MGASIKHRPCFSFRGAAQADGHARIATLRHDRRARGGFEGTLCRNANEQNAFGIFEIMPDFQENQIFSGEKDIEFKGSYWLTRNLRLRLLKVWRYKILKSGPNTLTNCATFLQQQFTDLFYYFTTAVTNSSFLGRQFIFLKSFRCVANVQSLWQKYTWFLIYRSNFCAA